MPIWNKIFLQNRNSPLIEHLTFFHDHRIIIIIIVTIITFNIIIVSLKFKLFNRYLLESHRTELFWTTLPALILIFIAIPSLKTLYLIEENISPLISVKTIGFQWHWRYEYTNIIGNKIISLIYPSFKLRLITTTNNLVIPTITPTRIMIRSKDVLHSWTIPSIGVKADAIPGRINQLIILIKRPGIFLGQCSEICGAGHRFIPIVIETDRKSVV